MFGINISSINFIGSSGRESNSVRGNSEQVTETRAVGPFDRIEAGGALEIFIAHSKETTLKISGDSNIISLITTTVSDGKLIISAVGSYQTSQGIKVFLTTPNLTGLEISGATNVVVEGLEGEALDLDFSGSANCTLKGGIRKLHLTASGASNIDTKGLQSEDVQVDVSGAASVKVRATTTAQLRVSGAANVEVFGSPATRKEKTSGAGTVRFR